MICEATAKNWARFFHPSRADALSPAASRTGSSGEGAQSRPAWRLTSLRSRSGCRSRSRARATLRCIRRTAYGEARGQPSTDGTWPPTKRPWVSPHRALRPELATLERPRGRRSVLLAPGHPDPSSRSLNDRSLQHVASLGIRDVRVHVLLEHEPALVQLVRRLRD